jgi:hypothetical protein
VPDSPIKPKINSKEIQERLAKELQEANLAYEAAAEQYQNAIGRMKNLGPDESVQWTIAVSEALGAQSVALENVSRALNALSRFVLKGEREQKGVINPPKQAAATMTDQEFEGAYREALVCLADVGHTVAGPVGTDGTRVCMIDGKPMRDYEVLELWWGKTICEQIRRERKH